MEQDLIEKVMKEVTAELQAGDKAPAFGPLNDVGMTEFVGTTMGHTYGLVIAAVDPLLVDGLKLGKFRSIGIIGSRTGAGPQLMAADEAVKATNTEVVSIELPRDTEGSGGHGCLIILGAEDVSDARRAVEITLEAVPKYFGEVYTAANNPDGHNNFLEFQYTARASSVLNKALGAPIGKAYGFTNGCPAAIAVVIADVAVKAANVEVIGVA
ncbi:MAG: propanediol utilization microcompartment protein PduB, partial [Lachnospiraceae bacterium]|nr:propanediol utilization microcompartment protein PduB [Lachnospiraceae bacterium]